MSNFSLAEKKNCLTENFLFDGKRNGLTFVEKLSKFLPIFAGRVASFSFRSGVRTPLAFGR